MLPHTTAADVDLDRRVYAKVVRRVMPLLFLGYVVAYLDRVNVGFAKLQMAGDLGFSETVYGLGAGIFFLGYFLFEVPSNLVLRRVGARVWIARIMISWGLVSVAMMWVTTPHGFYLMRFLLGVAEAGFFPGIILYLTQWFPSQRRARMTALFMTAVPVSGVIGGPLSGWILKVCDGFHGMAGWQWLFLLEGIPSVLVGLLILARLDDDIGQARWLDQTEKERLLAHIEREAGNQSVLSLRAAFLEPKLWILSLSYFGLVMGLYGVGFWLPTLIKATGVKNPLDIGLLSAIPYAVAVLAMLYLGQRADAHRERRWHFFLPCALGSLGLVLSASFFENTALAMAALTLACAGIVAALPLFWSCPTAFLGGAAAAAGIAMINSLGNLAGFVSPYMVGLIRDMTRSTSTALYVLAGCLLLSGCLVLWFMPPRLVNR